MNAHVLGIFSNRTLIPFITTQAGQVPKSLSDRSNITQKPMNNMNKPKTSHRTNHKNARWDPGRRSLLDAWWTKTTFAFARVHPWAWVPRGPSHQTVIENYATCWSKQEHQTEFVCTCAIFKNLPQVIRTCL